MPPRIKDKPTVECPACGATNPFGRLVCSRCGERLKFDPIETVKAHHVARKRRARRPLLNAAISFVCVWSTVTVLLAIWPFKHLGSEGDPRRAPEVRQAITRLNQAWQIGESAPPVMITEISLNGYFRDQARENRVLRVEIEANRIVLVGHEPMGPFVRGTRLVWSRADRDSPFEVESVWWGHLPLPRARADANLRGIVRRFHLEIPETFWDHAVVLDAARQRITVGSPAQDPGE